jgi:hypothetical protein
MGKVYAVSTVGLFAAAAGAKFNLESSLGYSGFMMVLAQIGLLFAIAATYTKKDDGVNPLRLALLVAFAFCAGINVGSYKIMIPNLDDQLVYDAFAVTTVLFSLFTVAGLLASPGILYIAIVTILVGSTVLFFTSLATLFGLVGLMAFNALHIKLGLVVSSMYIIFDTWLIQEEAKRGERDVISHSIRLLTDFLKVFVRILVLLSKNKKKRDD